MHPVSRGSDGVPCDSWSSPAGSLQTLWGWTGERKERAMRDHFYYMLQMQTLQWDRYGYKDTMVCDKTLFKYIQWLNFKPKGVRVYKTNKGREEVLASPWKIHVRKLNKTCVLGKTQRTVTDCTRPRFFKLSISGINTLGRKQGSA